jgi:hypothetical protein
VFLFCFIFFFKIQTPCWSVFCLLHTYNGDFGSKLTCFTIMYTIQYSNNGWDHRIYFIELIWIWNRHRLKSSGNRYQSWLLGNFRCTRRSENGRVVTIGPDALLFDTFRVSFVSSQGFSKSGHPDVLNLFQRHSVWISVLVKVNGILVKVNGIRHYSFIDLILPCFSHK